MNYEEIARGISTRNTDAISDYGITGTAIIKTILNRCQEEKDQNSLLAPLEDFKVRTSLYTDVPLQIINQLHKGTLHANAKISVYLQICIRKILKQSYSHPYPITFANLHHELKAQGIYLLDIESFSQAMLRIGYEMVNMEGYLSDPTVFENPKVTFDRFHYLKKVKTMRCKEKHIYFMDVSVQNDNSTDGNILYFYMISQDGYENGIFIQCGETHNQSFVKWIIHIVIPILKPSSFIIIKNDVFEAVQNKKEISEYHSKNIMLNWLKENNVPCNNNMPKAELFDLIEKCSIRKNQHIENIFKAHGHETICLSDALSEFSMTTLVLQGIVTEHSKLPHDPQKRDVDFIRMISKKKCWQYSETIKKYENDFFAIDQEVEFLLDKSKLKISVM